MRQSGGGGRLVSRERPKGGGIFVQQWFVPMTPTAVNNTTGLLPSADQPAPGPNLQTNDDRFLERRRELERATIWAADGTSCEPPGDTVQRACLDYLEITVDNGLGPPSPDIQVAAE